MFFKKLFGRRNHQHPATEKQEKDIRRDTTESLATAPSASNPRHTPSITDHEGTGKLLIDRMRHYIKGLEEERKRDIRYSLRDNWQSDYHAWLSAHSRYKTFRDFIMDLVQERNMDSVDFYNTAGLDRKLFSRPKNEQDYHPSKETAIRCCLALKLDTAQTEHVLGLAGYSLSWSLHDDLAVRYCIQNGIFSVFDVFEVLEMLR